MENNEDFKCKFEGRIVRELNLRPRIALLAGGIALNLAADVFYADPCRNYSAGEVADILLGLQDVLTTERLQTKPCKRCSGSRVIWIKVGNVEHPEPCPDCLEETR